MQTGNRQDLLCHTVLFAVHQSSWEFGRIYCAIESSLLCTHADRKKAGLALIECSLLCTNADRK